MKELQSFFEQSSYPSDLVKEVIDEVRSQPRVLGYKESGGNCKSFTPWIVTYGSGHEETKQKVREVNEVISNSRTWNGEEPQHVPKFQVVNRRAPNLKDTLFRRKKIALGTDSRTTDPCTDPAERKKGRPCQTCKVVSRSSTVQSNDRQVSTQGGNCKSRNIIYAATCKLCSKNNVYVGKTVTCLNQRVNGHRSKFYEILESSKQDTQFSLDKPGDIEDENVLGAHLFTVHQKKERTDFNECFKFDILCSTSPENLRKSEQFYIDRLNSLYPFGLNNVKSVSGN